MGALTIVKLAERYPTQYDGVLALCGPIGGALAELQYAGDARVTFDYYFPGVFPGGAFDVPPGTLYLSPFDPGGLSALFGSVFTALIGNPAATIQWATAAKLPFSNQTELGNSALYVIGSLLRYTNDFIEGVNGKMPYDNEGVAYPSAQLNQGVDVSRSIAPPSTLTSATARRAGNLRFGDDAAHHARARDSVWPRSDVRRIG